MKQKTVMIAAAVSLSLILLTKKGAAMLYEKPRGIRNNNAGNIEDNGTPWKGRKGNDGRFIIFDTPENGIRAIARILNTYRFNHGLTTIEGIINRWAPPIENNTVAYVEHVAKIVGIPANTAVSDANIPDLIKAIIKHENGVQPYSDKVINDGIAAA